MDDSDVIRHGIRSFLERWGYLCVEAADGVAAIKQTRDFRPDLIVMDLAMPLMNGVEASSVIRSTMPKVPIVAFTMHENLCRSMKSNLAISSVVSKPDGITKLMECIQSLLGSVS